MKIKGSYILREVVGEYVLIPVGDTALGFNGIISLNPVGAEIWKCLEQECDREAILKKVLDEFYVSPEEAEKDMDEFFALLQKNDLME